MSDKIEGIGRGLLQSASTKPANQEKPGDAPAAGKKAGHADSTTVSITRDALRLGRLDRALADAADVDVNKIEAIKSAIANGEYEIDADAIAAALLKIDRDIAGS